MRAEDLPTTLPNLVDRLAAHRTLGGAPRAELDWMAARGRLRRFAAGDIVTPPSGPIAGLYVVLAGQLSIHVNRGAGPRKVMEWREGDVTGVLPYSRLTSSPGEVVADQATEILLVDTTDLPGLIRECHEVTSILVHVMLDRARHFTSADLQDEKMLSLGRLSAGLAHELNNPASALVRSARTLGATLDEMAAAARALGAALTSEQLAVLDRVSHVCTAPGPGGVRSPIEQADREDAFAEWLTTHGLDPDAAEALAGSNADLPSLDALADTLDGDALHTAVRGLAAHCTARTLVSDIEIAAGRVHGLVAAIKGFTYMDRDAGPQPIDLRQGLSDTIAVLGGKARARSIAIDLRVDADLPAIDGYGGEINQVWANLIDNAIDAAGERGRVEIAAVRHPGAVAVAIVDNGPGIPDAIRGRIFDPFFTTKPVGQGTGLGLDLARRLVARHGGTIDVDSRPGRTEFRVTLPTQEDRRATIPDRGPTRS